MRLVLQITLQRPTVVAEIGFLLAVTKFFVPTMAISGVSPIPFASQDIYLEGKQLPDVFCIGMIVYAYAWSHQEYCRHLISIDVEAASWQ